MFTLALIPARPTSESPSESPAGTRVTGVETAARFVLLLAAGVGIMVLYVRAGESVVVLVLSLATLLIGLALWSQQPWRTDDAGKRTGAHPARGDGGGRGPDETWRCGHDIVWDERGVRAVAVGERLPELTVWSRIDGIAVGRHRSPVDDRGNQRRRGLRLELYQPSGRPPGVSDGAERWFCLGPDQDPERVAAELTSTWRRVAARRWYPEPER